MCEPRTGKRPVRGIGRRGDGTIQATVYTRDVVNGGVSVLSVEQGIAQQQHARK